MRIYIDRSQDLDTVLAGVAEKLTAYVREYHQKHPSLPLHHAMEVSMGRLMGEMSPRPNSTRLIDLAVAQMAANWILGVTASPAVPQAA